jgi:hypothetical protein
MLNISMPCALRLGDKEPATFFRTLQDFLAIRSALDLRNHSAQGNAEALQNRALAEGSNERTAEAEALLTAPTSGAVKDYASRTT